MNYNILVVDDSAVVRNMVKRAIAMAGLEGTILEASNGREALEILNGRWIDIVFADLNMPEMNGVEMVEKMAEDSILVSTPVVIVSSDQSEARIAELTRRGIRAYLKKPFRPEALKKTVEDVLSARSAAARGTPRKMP